jgi:peptidoglycan/xylan/chitin deacetylase (PgdA/CDA1 family)
VIKSLQLTALLLFLLLLTACEQTAPFSDKPLVVFTFDDNNASIYDTAYPMMQEFNFTGTIVANSGFIALPSRFTWEQLAEMTASGWEIAGHTVHHAVLTGISLEKAEAEIVLDLDAFRLHGFVPVSFALPKGVVSTEIFNIICHYYKNIRNSEDTVNFFPVDRKAVGYLPVQTFYSEIEVINRLQLASWRGECLIVLGFHKFYSDDAEYIDNCQPDEFRAILDYIREQNLEVVTLAQALDRCWQ